jgi:hypothetical protein
VSWNKASNRCSVCRFFQQTRRTFRHEGDFAFLNTGRATTRALQNLERFWNGSRGQEAVKSRQCDNAARLRICDKLMLRQAIADSAEILDALLNLQAPSKSAIG